MKTCKSLHKEQKLTTWVNEIYIKEKYQKQKADEDRILETDYIEEKERGLSSKAAGEKAARWLDSHVCSSEWTTKKIRFQEREHDLEVKDLRVHRRHRPSERLSPRKEGNTCFPKTAERGNVIPTTHVFIEHLLFSRLFQTHRIPVYQQNTYSHEASVPVEGKGKRNRKSCRKILSNRG